MKLYCLHGHEFAAQTLSLAQGFDFAGAIESVKWLDEGYVLFLDDLGLALCQTGRKAAGPVRCEFTTGSSRHRRLYGGGKSQTIAKAVGIKDKIRPVVADLTAGMGGDGFVLASLGCQVRLVERHPVAFSLLADGLNRAMVSVQSETDDSGLSAALAKISLDHGNAVSWLQQLTEADIPDVIYLDPMFPERSKSAQVNKTMQAFQQLVGDDPDADLLLPAALQYAKYRVVVKRPAHAPWLNDQEPGYALKGKSVRFDIYPLRAMSDLG